ncbi:hypothetical protein BKA69DRAFT_1128107 [Paraphysoderma sedebokerense]|nr:hypothetical protein BKA69DRAFT_1128107 [Paraphysoderma sedebokerense]
MPAHLEDRFTLRQIPGYTGYIPRSKEHIGKSFRVVTSAALEDFARIIQKKDTLPPRLQNFKNNGYNAMSSISAPEKGRSNAISEAPFKTKNRIPIDDKAFVNGYTGYIPHLRNHFGEHYTVSTKRAMEEWKSETKRREQSKQAAVPLSFDGDKLTLNLNGLTKPEKKVEKQQKSKNIPAFLSFDFLKRLGYTGFTTRSAICNPIGETTADGLPKKELAKNLPIPGYKGKIPLYQFTGNKSYGVTCKQCIETFTYEIVGRKKPVVEK